jgi:hypothetical protein
MLKGQLKAYSASLACHLACFGRLAGMVVDRGAVEEVEATVMVVEASTRFEACC